MRSCKKRRVKHIPAFIFKLGSCVVANVFSFVLLSGWNETTKSRSVDPSLRCFRPRIQTNLSPRHSSPDQIQYNAFLMTGLITFHCLPSLCLPTSPPGDIRKSDLKSALGSLLQDLKDLLLMSSKRTAIVEISVAESLQTCEASFT